MCDKDWSKKIPSGHKSGHFGLQKIKVFSIELFRNKHSHTLKQRRTHFFLTKSWVRDRDSVMCDQYSLNRHTMCLIVFHWVS